MSRPRVATYRMQLHKEFTLRDAAALVPYLSDLGVSDVYLSPLFAARPGSLHGYDVVDMNKVNQELGGAEALEELLNSAQTQGMNVLLDIVPNHCAFDSRNWRLMDVLEKGPHSKYFQYFDITWDHPYENIRGKVLAPFLGDFYARCLENGQIQLAYDRDGFCVRYYDFRLPLRLETYAQILQHGTAVWRPALSESRNQLQAIIRLLAGIGKEMEANSDFDYSGFVKDLIWELWEKDSGVRRLIEDNLALYNSTGKPGAAGESYTLLDDLLEEQYFRLAFWKVGTQELNYRRFFSVNDLISLRIDDPDVEAEWHRLVLRLVQEGRISGLRVDHVDGLYDPLAYLTFLRDACPSLYLVVEKILEPGEGLRRDWPVQGTTGYDFMDTACGVLCNPENGPRFEDIYRSFTSFAEPYYRAISARKREIVSRHMAGDIDNLALMLKRITNQSRQGKDLTMAALRRALIEILTIFPVYRTYVSQNQFVEEDWTIFSGVVADSVRSAGYYREELQLIGSFIKACYEGRLPEAEDRDWRNFIMRLQQYTGPLMAKGVEDTFFYVYNRLLARNEVGSDPAVLGYSPAEFHSFMSARAADWPLTMNSLSTHDTKRGEDARSAIAVISDLPAEWEEFLGQAQKMNDEYKVRREGRIMPTSNDEYLLYQALLGSLPPSGGADEEYASRLKEYLVKAAREAKSETSWLYEDADYEAALTGFAEAVLKSASFQALLAPLREKATVFGIVNSLAQTLFKLCCPGIPDLYQGTELWDFSFVDPDNRRAVDYELRRRLLQEVNERAERDRTGLLQEVLETPWDGRIKMVAVRQALALRNRAPELFLEGGYESCAGSGKREKNIIAFARLQGGRCAVAAAPRLLAGAGCPGRLLPGAEFWADTALRLPQPGRWSDVITGRPHELADGGVSAAQLFEAFPVALLINGRSSDGRD